LAYVIASKASDQGEDKLRRSNLAFSPISGDSLVSLQVGCASVCFAVLRRLSFHCLFILKGKVKVAFQQQFIIAFALS
jgi:hypothetical protein